MNRPDTSEFLPYYGHYISLVGEGDIVELLGKQINDTIALLGKFPESRRTFRYAPGKWSVNEVVGHLLDAERIFTARALRFARNDRTPLPGFEQDDYVPEGRFDDFPLRELADEFRILRRATASFFTHLSEEASTRRGIANGAEVSVRALAYIIAGHELHHRGVLREKYLNGE